MDIQFEILCILSEHGEFMPYVDLLNAMPSGGAYTKAQLVEMRRAGLVSGSLRAGSSVRLEAPGRALLLKLLEDSRAADAQREQRRTENEAAEAVRRKERSAERTRENRHRAEDKRDARRLAVISALLGGLVSFAVLYLAHLLGL